jgi:hypothetical protein
MKGPEVGSSRSNEPDEFGVKRVKKVKSTGCGGSFNFRVSRFQMAETPAEKVKKVKSRTCGEVRVLKVPRLKVSRFSGGGDGGRSISGQGATPNGCGWRRMQWEE